LRPAEEPNPRVRLARRREGERLAEQYGIDAGIADPLQPEHAGTDAAEDR
jgi:hypothetical protein